MRKLAARASCSAAMCDAETSSHIMLVATCVLAPRATAMCDAETSSRIMLVATCVLAPRAAAVCRAKARPSLRH
jgi:hypothetical protein